MDYKNKVAREQYEKRAKRHLKPKDWFDATDIPRLNEKTSISDLTTFGGF